MLPTSMCSVKTLFQSLLFAFYHARSGKPILYLNQALSALNLLFLVEYDAHTSPED